MSTALSLVLILSVPGTVMDCVSLDELIKATGGEAIGSVSRDISVPSISIDSRTIATGEVFWALPGERHDGYDFVSHAFSRGAVAAVVGRNATVRGPAGPTVAVPDSLEALWSFARWYRDRQEALVIGVTGSVGKTTTREMLHTVLSARFDGTCSPRNYNNHVGVPLSLLQIESSHDFAVLEMGASGLNEIRDLAGMAAPEVGVITAIGPAHLQGFGSEREIIKAKAEMIEALPQSGFAVLPGDDARLRAIAARAACRVIFVGEGSDNDLRALDVEAANQTLSFSVDGTRYEIPVVGRHHLASALIAIAIGREVGIESGALKSALAGFVPVPARCRAERIGSWTVVDDTYNASPASVQAACDVLRDWRGAGKRLLVVGDMLELGADSDRFHRQVGHGAAAAGVDFLVVFGQQAGQVIRGALAAGMPAHRLAECGCFDAVGAVLDCWIEPGDVVLVKGSRAMRMERVVDRLRRQATQTLNEDTSRAPARAVA